MKIHVQNTTQGYDINVTLSNHELTCLVYAVLAHWRERSDNRLIHTLSYATKSGVDILNISVKPD